MTIATGVKKKIAYKKETTWGTLAGATSAKYLRRVSGVFNLKKETFESGEIRTDYQVADMRHGIRSAEGSLSGELSPRTYADFFQAIVARDFTAGVAATAQTLTIAAGSGTAYTVTRAAGSFLADGFKIGTVVRLSGANINAANAAKNLLVTGVTALALTVQVLNSSALVAQATAAASDVTTVGKTTYVPTSGHTDQSFTVEEFYTDISQSEVFTGMKVGSVGVSIPASGFTTTDISFMGKDMAQTGTTQYFTTPTAAGTDFTMASTNGLLVVNGTPVALLTSVDFSIERAMENAQVVGSNSIADMLSGRIRCSGNFSAYFTDGTFRDYFANESTISLIVTVASSNAANADFISFTFPKIKVGSADKNDGESGITTTHSFTALLNDVTSAGLEGTTVQIQESQA